MPCCVTVSCSNRPGRGLKVHRFPNDPERRKTWEINTKRKNWKASKSSILCEKSSPRKARRKQVIDTTDEYVPQDKHRKIEHSYSKDDGSSSNNVEVNTRNKGLKQVTIATESTTSVNRQRELDLLMQVKELQNKIAKIEKDYADERKSKEEILKAQRTQDLKISEVFNSDQLLALGRKTTRGCKWSIKTIKKALQLRLACGATGYELLLSQGQPLPSTRTLRRKLEVLNSKRRISGDVRHGIVDDVIQVQKNKTVCSLTLDEFSPWIEYDTFDLESLEDSCTEEEPEEAIDT